MYDKKYLEKDKEEKEKWEKLYEILKEHDVKFVTDFEIPIKKLYTLLDVKGDYLDKVNFNNLIVPNNFNKWNYLKIE